MKKSFWQQFPVSTLRYIVRSLRLRAILLKEHLFNTRRTKQDLVGLLDSLFRVRRGSPDVAQHRRIRFELYHFRGRFSLSPDLKKAL